MEQLISHGMHECRSACHELVVVRILVFAPMSVDADLLDADDWAIFHASTSPRPRTHTAACSQYVYRAGWRKRAPERRVLHHEEPPRAVPTRGVAKGKV